MNIKKFYLKEFIDYGKHRSSYFNLPAGLTVVIAYLLPGIIGMININFSYFATLVLILVAVFEKNSPMVKFYCIQFSILAIGFNLILSLFYLLSRFIPTIQIINVMLSFIIALITIFCYLYSLFRALQYKAWIIPWIGSFILNKIMKVNY